MGEQLGTIVSVNVGRPRVIEWRGRRVRTSIWKAPVSDRVRIEGVNLAGDEQADHRVHGGPNKAVYGYATEDYEWWAGELGGALEPGTFGENLTTKRIDLDALDRGEHLAVGTAVLAVRGPRQPCYKLGIRMGDDAFVERFGAAGRLGRYFAIVEAGDVAVGDAITRV
jgi:MOSC domain-containing protein YiiM